jgi:hypothetical protein
LTPYLKRLQLQAKPSDDTDSPKGTTKAKNSLIFWKWISDESSEETTINITIH